VNALRRLPPSLLGGLFSPCCLCPLLAEGTARFRRQMRKSALAFGCSSSALYITARSGDLALGSHATIVCYEPTDRRLAWRCCGLLRATLRRMRLVSPSGSLC
jgi:hypothetical protein